MERMRLTSLLEEEGGVWKHQKIGLLAMLDFWIVSVCRKGLLTIRGNFFRIVLFNKLVSWECESHFSLGGQGH